ncbi:MAG: zf-HC2 domain-containing protein [Gammaproteobacteria bacterium]|nr:zf-HC2 domain-containing protein [Gammaproteobacteria bacterium]
MADEDVKESISALVDGELSAPEMQSVIRHLRTNDEDRCCWHNYHLIGDALRNNLPPAMDNRLAERVSAAIASEPVLQVTITSAKAVRKKANHTRSVAGFAVAASVAVVGFLGFSMIAVEDQPVTARVASIASSPVIPIVEQNHYQQVHGLQWTEQQPAVQSRLNAYLQNHQQLSGAMVINGRMVPRAQFAVEMQAYNQ